MKYRLHIHYSAEDEGYIATIPELPGCSAFGDTIEDAAREIQTAADAWLETARELKRDVPEPSALRRFSGKLVLRMPPELHRALDECATDAGVSLNQYLVFLLARALGQWEVSKASASWSTHINSLSEQAWERFAHPASKSSVIGDATNFEAMRASFFSTLRDVLQKEHKSHLWSVPVGPRSKKPIPEEDE